MTPSILPTPQDGTITRKVFGYVRVSDKRQEVERQEQTLPERHKTLPDGLADLPLEELFYDHGISAWSGKTRPGFEEMCARIARGEAAALIVDTSSRLTRGGIREALDIFWQLQDGDCRLFTTQGREYGSDIGGIIGLIVDAEGDQRYSSTLGHNIASGKAAKAREGRPYHGRLVPGYHFNKETKELEVTDDLRLIREAADRFLAGETYKSIADFLTATLSDDGLSLLKNKNRRVTRDRVREWLAHPLYAGMIPYHRGKDDEELVEGQHTPAWSIEKFEAIQRLLNAKRDKNAARTPRSWPFTGIAKCPTCGHSQRVHPVTKNGETRWFYVRCAGDDCPRRHRSPIAASFEANILTGLSAIAYVLDDILASDASYGDSQPTEKPDKVRVKLAEADAEVARIQKELILAPSLRDDLDVDAARQEALRTRDTLAAQLDRIVTQAKSHRDELRDLVTTVFSLADDRPEDRWEGHIAEETVTLIDEKAGRGEPDVRTFTVQHEGHARPTMLAILDGWRTASFETKCAVIRASLRTVKVGDESVEYNFARGFDTPIVIRSPFASERGPILKSLERSGFGTSSEGVCASAAPQ